MKQGLLHRRGLGNNGRSRTVFCAVYGLKLEIVIIQSRMARKTWVTTKASWALQAHLDLYIAFNNGYKLTV
jgi:hypothetical protein